MDTKEIIKSQYRAALAMLGEAISKCPEELWDDPTTKLRFWHVAYHTLFYTHLYLQVDGAAFVPWSKHRDEYEFLETLPWDPNKARNIGAPYTKAELLAYHALCQQEVEDKVALLDLALSDNTGSGFDWLPFSKLELQFYNIRHIQHHTGQLNDRLRVMADIGIDWIGTQPADKGK